VIEAVLSGRRVRLRPVRAEDEDALLAIFSDPSVATWWGEPARSVSDALNPDEGQSGFMIESGSEPVGFIQCVEETDPTYRHAGIDIAIRADHQGQGLGPEAIRVLAEHLFNELGHHRLTIDPSAKNQPAIEAYRKVGFRPVGVMRQYEQGPSGEWRDGLLMDLLKGELT
jgi:aminoglycoside 6'-N-acetyltransferase